MAKNKSKKSDEKLADAVKAAVKSERKKLGKAVKAAESAAARAEKAASDAKSRAKKAKKAAAESVNVEGPGPTPEVDTLGELTRLQLLDLARDREIPNRSRMTKAQLQEALALS